MAARIWTKAAVLADAKRFDSKTAWSRAGSAYVVAHRNGWLDEACAHMVPRWEARWDKSAVLASAAKYANRAAWKSAEPGAYKSALRNHWHDAACAHMVAKRRSWTLQLLRASAAPFSTRSAWKDADGAAYKAARDRGILDRVCAHMAFASKPDGWWTKRRVIESARKYRSVPLWNEAETSAVQIARRRGWIAEATKHMDAVPLPIGPATVHEFLLCHRISYRAEYRFKQHPAVSKMPFDFYLPERNLLIEYHGRQHREGWSRDANSRREIQRRDRTKKRWAAGQGIHLLALLAWREKTQDQVRARLSAALGVSKELPRRLSKAQESRLRSGLAWTPEEVFADARKYRSRREWQLASPNAYSFARRHALAAEATRHMPRLVEHGKWTKDAVVGSAMGYPTLASWRKSVPSAGVIAYRRGWIQAVMKATGWEDGRRRREGAG